MIKQRVFTYIPPGDDKINEDTDDDRLGYEIQLNAHIGCDGF